MAARKDAGEDLSMRRRRLRYRAWHRGTREMDLILGPFADARAERFDGPELDRFEALLDAADTELLNWVTGIEPMPAHVDGPLLRAIVAFRLKTAS